MATHSSVLAWRIQGQGSLVGCRLWGPTELDTTEATQQQQQQQQQQLSRIRLFANFPGKNTGVDQHFLLQGIFPTQGLNPRQWHFLPWQVDSLPLVPPFIFIKYLFSLIWLQQVSGVACRVFTAACGTLSCGEQTLRACWIHFPDQELNPGPLHWDCRVLAPGLPRKSQAFYFKGVDTFNSIFMVYKNFYGLILQLKKLKV